MEAGQATMDLLASGFPAGAQWSRGRSAGQNRFALLPRFGFYANLFLPVKDDAMAICGDIRDTASSLPSQK